MTLRSVDQLSRVSINRNQLNLLLKLPDWFTRFLPSFVPLRSMLSHIKQYQFAAEHLEKESRVLDVACGVGYGSEILRLHGNNVVGVDINPDNIEFARKNYPDNSYSVGDAEDLAYPDRSFDAIVSIQTIEHLNHPNRAMKGFKRLIRSEGFLIGAIPINCRHKLNIDSEAKEVYLIADCKNLVMSVFDNIQWFFNDFKTNRICETSEIFLEGLTTHCGDFVFIARQEAK